jgi:histidine triad (HIT) family protein
MSDHGSSTSRRPGRFTCRAVELSCEHGLVNDCIFCGILAGEIPADVVAESETVLAFRDRNPQAPLHVLVIPRTHATNVAELADLEPETVAELVRVAQRVTADAGYDSYRLVANTGEDAGQSVFHTHLHVLAGRTQAWPPG